MTHEIPTAVNLKLPPVEPSKPVIENTVTAKPIVTKRVSKIKIDLPSYSIADLQMATGSFNVDNLVGEGSFGRVYRAQFDDGKVYFIIYTLKEHTCLLLVAKHYRIIKAVYLVLLHVV